MDLGSPVSLDDHERAPFAFDGVIHKLHIRHTDPFALAELRRLGDPPSPRVRAAD